jgi:hypothetical protein
MPWEHLGVPATHDGTYPAMPLQTVVADCSNISQSSTIGTILPAKMDDFDAEVRSFWSFPPVGETSVEEEAALFLVTRAREKATLEAIMRTYAEDYDDEEEEEGVFELCPEPPLAVLLAMEVAAKGPECTSAGTCLTSAQERKVGRAEVLKRTYRGHQMVTALLEGCRRLARLA